MSKRKTAANMEIIGDREILDLRLNKGYVVVAWFSIFFLWIFAPIPIVFAYQALAKKKRNNKNPNPTIALSEDGTFVIWHPKGKQEWLRDRVTRARAQRAMHGVVHTGDYYGRPQHQPPLEYGKVFFTLQNERGTQYTKCVDNVSKCDEVAKHINEILTLKGNKQNFTRDLEKTRNSCRYCGSRILPEDRVCAQCGGRL